MDKNILIQPYQPHHQPGISELLDSIQGEYTRSIYSRNPPANPLPVKLWVALHNEMVIGTVGITLLSDHNAVLKSMFVMREFRGAATGIATRLMDTALQYAKNNSAENIYLGTMTQFAAAQRFYRKHGFRQISVGELPPGFIINPVDDVFFMRALNELHYD